MYVLVPSSIRSEPARGSASAPPGRIGDEGAPLLEGLGKPLTTLKSWVAGAHYSSEAGMKELGFTGSVFFQTFPACTHPDGHE